MGARYQRGQVLESLEQHNLQMRLALLKAREKAKQTEAAQAPKIEKTLSATNRKWANKGSLASPVTSPSAGSAGAQVSIAQLLDTINVVASASATLRADLAVLLEEQRKLLIKVNTLEDPPKVFNQDDAAGGDDENESRAMRGSMSAPKKDDKKGEDKNDENELEQSIDDEIRSHIAHSLIHTGVSAPLDSCEGISLPGVQSFWEGLDEKSVVAAAGVNVAKIAELVRVNTAFMEEMSAAMNESETMNMMSQPSSSASADTEATPNMGFSLATPPGALYVFDEEDNEENILYHSGDAAAKDIDLKDDGVQQAIEPIRAATLNKLIEKLTAENSTDLNLRFVFMLTYMSFTNPLEVLDKLERRYYVPTPPNVPPEELDFWRKNKLAPIQIKVFGVLKYWISEHWEDFTSPEVNARLKDIVSSMIKNITGPWSKKSGKYLWTLIEKREKGEKRNIDIRTELAKPLIKVTLTYREFEQAFLEHSEEEIARQICIQDFKKFKEIEPRECLNQNWSKHKELAPNLILMIDGFNRMTSWVQIEVLSISDLNKRVKMLKKILRIAEVSYSC
jgi:hypothetical protein